MEPTATQEERETDIIPAQEDLTERRNRLALTKVSTFHNPMIWDQISRIAKQFLDSMIFKDKNLAQIIVKLEAGYEMGMQSVEAMNSLYVVGGKILLYGDAMTRRFRQFGWKITWLESTELKCKVRVEKGDEAYEEEATIDEARKAGLVERNPEQYIKYPKRKLRWNALHMILSFDVPEVAGNFGIKEVYEDIEVIDHDTGKVTTERMKRKAPNVDPDQPMVVGDEPKIGDFQKEEPKAEEKPEPRKRAKRKTAEEAKAGEAAHEGNAQIPIDEKAPANGEDYVIDKIRILLKKTGRDETKLCEYFGRENLEALTDEERKRAIEIIEADKKAEDEPKPDAFDQAFDDAEKNGKTETMVGDAKRAFYKDKMPTE